MLTRQDGWSSVKFLMGDLDLSLCFVPKAIPNTSHGYTHLIDEKSQGGKPCRNHPGVFFLCSCARSLNLKYIFAI